MERALCTLSVIVFTFSTRITALADLDVRSSSGILLPWSPTQAALTKASRMKDRFHEVFIMDESRNPRTWHPREDIAIIARTARAAAANVLAQLAVIRRPEQVHPRDAGSDAVERAVLKLVQQVGRAVL